MLATTKVAFFCRRRWAKRSNLMNKSTTRVDHPLAQASENVASDLSSQRGKKRWVRLVVSLSLGIALMVVVYRNFDFGELLAVLRSNSISWGIILLSILVEVLGNVIRGARWRLLVHPFSTPAPRVRNTILSVLGSYAVNLIFPRAGDVWRCAALSRYESLSMAKLVGSLLMDRLMDMLVLGLIVLMAIGVFSDFLGGYFVEHPDLSLKVSHLVSSPLFYLTLLALGVLGYLFWRLSKRSRWGAKVREGLRDMWEGLLSIRFMPHRGLFILYTIGIWGCYFVAFYLTFFAFPFTQDLGINVGLLAFVMGCLGVAAPVQSGIGAWHFMVITTLTAVGVERSDAGSFALVVHTSQTLGNALIGLIAILVIPLLNRNYSRTQ